MEDWKIARLKDWIFLKESLAPGSISFLLLAALPGLVLLFRRRDGGRIGKIWMAALLLSYWMMSTPIAALTLVGWLTPDLAIRSRADAAEARAIVVLGAGMEVHRSRESFSGAPTREGALRVLEAARVFRLLGGDLPIIVTGGLGWSGYSEADLMSDQLTQLGVPAPQILKEEGSNNTRDHALLVPALLKERGIVQFVLVTSRQHVVRALAAFRAVGLHPIPSTPEVYARPGHRLEMYLPSRVALMASQSVLYDLFARVYYRWRGWA